MENRMRYSQKKCGILYINKVSIGSLTVSGSSIDRISFLHRLLLDDVQSVRHVASRFINRGYQYPKFIFFANKTDFSRSHFNNRWEKEGKKPQGAKESSFIWH
ncbi:MAG: hypothetical protein PUC31_04570 [Bacteroidales bacterium]|nr:hypothetical protein [Bacteroidales bacterium]